MTDSLRAAVLLDIDGTLVDSTYHHALAWYRAFHSVVGADRTPALWRIHRTIGMGGDKLVAEVSDEQTEQAHGEELREAWERNYTEVEQEVQALPGVTAMVRDLLDRGYVVALASSGKKHFSRNAADLLGIADDIALLTTSEDAEESKPEADLLHVTLEKLQDAHAIDRAVMVGDTPYDVEAAARAGLSCLAVRTGGFGVDELERAGAAQVVEDLAGYADIDWEALVRPVEGNAGA
jgi:HAD superfamily hydrolase (TIGR01549 family)